MKEKGVPMNERFVKHVSEKCGHACPGPVTVAGSSSSIHSGKANAKSRE